MPSILKNCSNGFIIFCFILFISTPLITHMLDIFDEQYIETNENRRINKMPPVPKTISEFHDFPEKVTRYFNDFFGFRALLIKGNNILKKKMGLSSSIRVILGKEGWLYLTDEDMIPQYCGLKRFSPAEKDYWIQKMEERGAWMKARGIPFYIVIAPNKMTVYPEYLPDWINKLPFQTRLEQLETLDYPPENFSLVSLKSSIFKAKIREPQYYRTDSHWNHHGAFTGYQAIMARLKTDFPILSPISEKEIHFSYYTSFGQDLSRVLNLPDMYPDPYADRYELKKPSMVHKKQRLDREKPYPLIVHTGELNKPTALIYRDSYTDAMEYLFNESFQTVIYANYDWMVFDKTLIEKYEPDLVLHIMVERMLRYVPDNSCLTSPRSELTIKNWGPASVTLGNGFNVQPNGQSALWMIGENVSKDTVICWEGKALKTQVDPEQSVLTALVPKELYATEGRYTIFFKDEKTGLTSTSVYFTVSR